VEPVLRRRAFEKHRGYLEEVFGIALRTLGWSRDIELPSYCQKCRLIDLDVLSTRRRVSCALFISDVLSCKLDSPIILNSLRLNVYLFNTNQSYQQKIFCCLL
jgi:hypothetical protein